MRQDVFERRLDRRLRYLAWSKESVCDKDAYTIQTNEREITVILSIKTVK